MYNHLFFDAVGFSCEFKNFVRIYIYDTLDHSVFKKDFQIISRGLIEDLNGNIEKTHPFTGEKKKFREIDQFKSEFWRERKNGGLNSYLKPIQQFLFDEKTVCGYWLVKNPSVNDVYFENFFDCRNLRAMAFDIETEVISGVPSPENPKEKILSCAFSYIDKNNQIRNYVAYWAEEEVEIEGVETVYCETEEELIKFILDILFNKPDAGIIVGFNSKEFDIPYILARAEKLRIPHFYELNPQYEGLRKQCYWDFPHIDLYRIFSESGLKNYIFKGKYTRNSLRDIALDQLDGIEKLHVDFQHSTIEELVIYNARDSEITLRLFQKAIDPLLLLSRVSKTPISIIQNSSISTWVKNIFDLMLMENGFFLLNDFQKKLKKEDSDEIEQTGGLVLEPPIGVFKNIACFDFSSEYPTIVISQNLSFENVNICDHDDCPISIGSDIKIVQNGNELLLEKRNDPTKICMKKRGLFSLWMETLRNYRVNVYKKLAKTNNRYFPWSEGIKLLMNSSIGVFGSKNFEYHSSSLFNAVTRMGQYSLYQLKLLIETFFPNNRVLYGATDSIFVLPVSLDEIKENAPKIIDLVKKRLGLDLEFEKIFEIIFFSGAKSNYLAFHKESLKSEVKGLSIQKSNSFEFGRVKFDEFVENLKTFLKENPNWTTEEVKTFIEQLIVGYIESLKKSDNPNDFVFIGPYQDKEYKSNPPHRQAYKKMNSNEQSEAISSGVIKYIKHIDEYVPISRFSKEKIDINKYIELLVNGFGQITKSLELDLESKFLNIKKSRKLTEYYENITTKSSEKLTKRSKKSTKSDENIINVIKKSKSLLDFL